MKKKMILLVVGIMVFASLTGCGKSDEQKALDEIGSHVAGEANSDGVDLQKELEADKNAVDKSNEEKADKKVRFQEIDAKYADKITEAYDTFYASTKPDEIKESAQIYNQLVTEEKEELTEINFPSTHVLIPESIYNCKAMYYKTAIQYLDKYNQVKWAVLKEKGMVILDNYDEESENITGALIIKADGTILEINITDFIDDSNRYIEIDGINENEIVFSANSADSMKNYFYTFDISKGSITAPQTSEEIEELTDSYRIDIADDISEEGINELAKRMTGYN